MPGFPSATRLSSECLCASSSLGQALLLCPGWAQHQRTYSHLHASPPGPGPGQTVLIYHRSSLNHFALGLSSRLNRVDLQDNPALGPPLPGSLWGGGRSLGSLLSPGCHLGSSVVPLVCLPCPLLDQTPSSPRTRTTSYTTQGSKHLAQRQERRRGAAAQWRREGLPSFTPPICP